jgi:DNA-binding transcriptional LysR family regulator
MYNHQLDTFIRVVEAGSFSKAATEAHITPTAIMKQINLLEAGLGLQLFVRTHRGLSLTEAGKSLYRDSKYIIQYSKDSITRAKNAMQKTDNIIRIGTSPMTPGQFLVELWPNIHKYCPDIKFQLIPFENTPENAREILMNLGKNIDIVAGIYDNALLRTRGCDALELSKAPVRCAVSIHHRLAEKGRLTFQDMYGENLMLIRRGWNGCVDALRDEVWQNHPEIYVVDFDFYNLSVFNQCENSNDILMTIDTWKNVHPLLKILPVEWKYTIPFGLLHAPQPDEIVRHFLDAVQKIVKA